MTQSPAAAIAIAQSLRAQGVRAQVYGEQKKFKQKMTYANKLGVPYIVLLGDDEIAQGKCSVKDMRSGEQVCVTPEEAAALILADKQKAASAAVILEK
jgi:histidyl-tRNA synthetase